MSSVKLLPRVYMIRDELGRRRLPSAREALAQYVHSVNFVRDRRKTMSAVFEAGYLATIPATVLFFAFYVNVPSLLAYFACFYLLANVYNTVWYHRYCSHYAFRFSHPLIPKLFLWFNPFGYREEVYALNHYVHHNHSDEDQDPYGPHLGWLGTYLASSCNLDTAITEREYDRLKHSVAHIGFPCASFESFRRWATVESIPHYLGRWFFATVFWTSLWYAVGGLRYVLMWYAVQFAFHAAARDFNYRGHGGGADEPPHVEGWDFARNTRALNQRFYGWLAGEWHNNHHAFRASANAGFLPGQVDVPFLMIKAAHRVGLVSRFNDHRELFQRRYLVERRSALAGVAVDSPEAASRASMN
jgi:stearoyl-CoA desaturase (delta-9 desaturase)